MMKPGVILAGILLGTAGFVGNWFKLELFFSVDFLLGSFFVMTALLRYGSGAGIMAGLIASICTVLLWHHPWAVVILSAEAVFVGLLYRRRGNLLTQDILYWLSLGPLLVWFFYGTLLQMPFNMVLLVIFKQAVNGIFNALLAQSLYLLLQSRSKKNNSQLPTLRQYIFTALMLVSTLVALLYTTLMVRILADRTDTQLAQHAVNKTIAACNSINNWLEGNRITLQSLAASLQGLPLQGTTSVQTQLEAFRSSTGIFKRLGMLDVGQKTVAYSPFVAPDNRPTIGVNLADRPHIQAAKASGVWTVGDLVIARSGSAEPIIPVVLPFGSGQAYRGCLVASLSLARLQKLMDELQENRPGHVTLVDRNNIVIVSTRSEFPAGSRFALPENGTIRTLANGVVHWTPPLKQGISAMQRWKQSFFINRHQLGPQLPWQVITELSFEPAINELTTSATYGLGIILILLLLVSLLASLISRKLSNTIATLQTTTRELPRRLLEEQELNWPSSRILEVAGLTDNFREMAMVLKERMNELADARTAADSANRAKSEFLANMSHEIRTPMTGLVGMVQLLQLTGPTEEQKECLDHIQSCTDSLLSLLNDILDLSKIEAGKFQLESSVFSLGACINEVVTSQRLLMQQKGLEFTSTRDPLLPDLLIGDKLRIRQILLNLLGNAVKFTEQGGITITVQAVAHQGDHLTLRLEVRDTGIGMTPQTLARIFAPFEQADASTTRRYGGSGLGLTICRKLAELMGGSISAVSSVGEGSCFSLELPLQIAPVVEQPEPDLQQSAGSQPQQMISCSLLLVEDNEVNATFLSRVLTRMGYQVSTATDGLQALEQWRSASWDCILMDLQMPVLDGIEATRMIRQEEQQRGGHTVVIALTAHALRGDRERILAEGFDHYIAKPVDIPLLLETLALVTAKEQR